MCFYSSAPDIVSFYGVISQRITLQEDSGAKPKVQSLTAAKGLAPPPLSPSLYSCWSSVCFTEISFTVILQIQTLKRIWGSVWPYRTPNVQVRWSTCIWICHVVRTHTVWSPELRLRSIRFSGKCPGVMLSWFFSSYFTLKKLTGDCLKLCLCLIGRHCTIYRARIWFVS